MLGVRYQPPGTSLRLHSERVTSSVGLSLVATARVTTTLALLFSFGANALALTTATPLGLAISRRGAQHSENAALLLVAVLSLLCMKI